MTQDMPPAIVLQNVTKFYLGQPAPVVNDISFKVDSGKVLVLVGPSGCGKSTTLKMINRLVEPSSGKILVDGIDIAKEDPVRLRRKMGYVIQEVGLFPHMTIDDNISLLARLEGWSRTSIDERVNYLLTSVRLDPNVYLHRYPKELSGGQAQRIGIARSLVLDPKILLMDEPFGALDPVIRSKMQEEFLSIMQEFKKTIVFVTHDLNEALKMGDLVAVMNEGRIIQIGSPHDLLREPIDEFVSNFIGSDKAVKLLGISTVGDIISSKNIKAAIQQDGIDTSVAVKKETNALLALELMLQNRRTYVPVLSNSNTIPVGILTFDAIMDYVHIPKK